jgi:TonB-dependent SusC/RagA subfamily outer membrane receptor
VLKDASSTAIYGARGANGVVIITTKSGYEGKATISYNMYYGIKDNFACISNYLFGTQCMLHKWFNRCNMPHLNPKF